MIIGNALTWVNWLTAVLLVTVNRDCWLAGTVRHSLSPARVPAGYKLLITIVACSSGCQPRTRQIVSDFTSFSGGGPLACAITGTSAATLAVMAVQTKMIPRRLLMPGISLTLSEVRGPRS